jgi:hypothetical protein
MKKPRKKKKIVQIQGQISMDRFLIKKEPVQEQETSFNETKEDEDSLFSETVTQTVEKTRKRKEKIEDTNVQNLKFHPISETQNSSKK